MALFETKWLERQIGENIVFHLNLPFPLAFPTAPVLPLGSGAITALEAVARAALCAFGLEGEPPYAGLHEMHGIVRIYGDEGSLIGWHKDKRCFEECIIGVVLENNLPGGAGLRFRPDGAHTGDEYGLDEAAGECFMMRGEARHGWEHGFAMPRGDGTPRRRVTLTMRWYRLSDAKTNGKLARWRRDGMRNTLFVQFVPECVVLPSAAAGSSSGSSSDGDSGGDAQEATAARLRALVAGGHTNFVLPVGFALEKLRRLAAARLGGGAVSGLTWRDTGRPLDHEAGWREVCAEYLQTQPMRPVLQLVVVLGTAGGARPRAAAQGQPELQAAALGAHHPDGAERVACASAPLPAPRDATTNERALTTQAQYTAE